MICENVRQMIGTIHQPLRWSGRPNEMTLGPGMNEHDGDVLLVYVIYKANRVTTVNELFRV
jgi:hypothetical protein